MLKIKVMKKAGFIIGLLMLTSAMAVAQKYAFVDSEYIRKNIPAFNTAQEQLDKLSQQWEKEVADGYAVVEQMYKSYQNEAPLLSQDMKTKREEAIIAKEKEMKDLQNKYFGMEGDLFKKREELVKPIQDEILKAIKDIAVEGSYAVIFDTASGGNILFANPKFDISDQVLEKLGYKN
jgi:outer membrane protein